MTVYEAGPSAGGMMRFGIPEFRFPRHILDAEIARISALGVAFVLNTRVDDLAELMREGKFDAVFLGTGAQIAHRAYIPACDSAHILDALSVLRNTADDTRLNWDVGWLCMGAETPRWTLHASHAGLERRNLWLFIAVLARGCLHTNLNFAKRLKKE